jgi:hypothetical protein
LPRTAENPLDTFIKSLRHQKKTILLIVGVAAITLSLSIIIPMLIDMTTHLNLPSVGMVYTIGVKAYYDPGLKNITTQIQWGKTYPGSSINKTLYIKSISNVQTQLHLQTANWTLLNSTNAIVSGPSPTTPYLNLTWNYDNKTIIPGKVIHVTLTLSVADSQTFVQFLVDNKVTSFRFDIVIDAVEQTT